MARSYSRTRWTVEKILKIARSRNSKTRLNHLIDLVMHPMFRSSKTAVLVDGLLHAVVEGNPRESLRKFIRYNLKYLLR